MGDGSSGSSSAYRTLGATVYVAGAAPIGGGRSTFWCLVSALCSGAKLLWSRPTPVPHSSQ